MALLAVLMAGCGTAGPGTSADGPLNGPDYSDAGSGKECIPQKKEGGAWFLGDELHNYGHKTVVIDKITLRKANGLRLVEAVIVRTSTAFIGYGYGYGYGWPPALEARNQPGIDWPHRRKAVGATISPQPTNAKTANNLDLGDCGTSQTQTSPTQVGPRDGMPRQ
ncbi:hypothetical protein [Streptomyces sp. 351MFTsu5.1]|uniref:hypothetical protein n=1 Tax=Streptomyces sp. 351MFTsu5.1 TaxID=1172180 RepID=UPI001319D552|nr:hypothetical protein [Streptomyces sp. 351MFTsu5.1]